MPYRFPDCPGPGLSRDTTFTLQTFSYQQVFCSINSRSVFYDGTFFNKEYLSTKASEKGGKFKYVPLLWWGFVISRHTFEIAREIWKSNREQLQKVCNYYTSSDLKILLLFWSGRHVKKVFLKGLEPKGCQWLEVCKVKVVSRDSPGHDASGIRYGIHLSRQKYCELILFNVSHEWPIL